MFCFSVYGFRVRNFRLSGFTFVACFFHDLCELKGGMIIAFLCNFGNSIANEKKIVTMWVVI